METTHWIREIELENAITVTIPVLVAPWGDSTIFSDYNPKATTPYIVVLDEFLIVKRRELLKTWKWLTDFAKLDS